MPGNVLYSNPAAWVSWQWRCIKVEARNSVWRGDLLEQVSGSLQQARGDGQEVSILRKLRSATCPALASRTRRRSWIGMQKSKIALCLQLQPR